MAEVEVVILRLPDGRVVARAASELQAARENEGRATAEAEEPEGGMLPAPRVRL